MDYFSDISLLHLTIRELRFLLYNSKKLDLYISFDKDLKR